MGAYSIYRCMAKKLAGVPAAAGIINKGARPVRTALRRARRYGNAVSAMMDGGFTTGSKMADMYFKGVGFAARNARAMPVMLGGAALGVYGANRMRRGY